jgi:hypothetical protein
MNAGMYCPEYSPAGHYIEEGQVIRRVISHAFILFLSTAMTLVENQAPSLAWSARWKKLTTEHLLFQKQIN